MTAEGAVEMGNVAEAVLVAMRDAQAAQGGRSACGGPAPPVRQDESGKRGSGLLEQLSHIARRNAVAGRDQFRRQIAAAELAQDIGLDGGEPRRLGAAGRAQLGVVAAGAERQRRQVDDVVGHALGDRRFGHFIAGLHDVEIAHEQAERRAAAWDRLPVGLRKSGDPPGDIGRDNASVMKLPSVEHRAGRRIRRREHAGAADAVDQFSPNWVAEAAPLRRTLRPTMSLPPAQGFSVAR